MTPLPQGASGIPDWVATTEQDVRAASNKPRKAYKWIFKASDKRVSYDALGDPEGFTGLSAKLLTALIKAVRESKHAALDRAIRKRMRETRKASIGQDNPSLFQGRQAPRVITEYFETEQGHGGVHAYDDLFELQLINGREQEFFDR